MNWSTKEEAIEGDDNNKRRVAEDTFHSYYNPSNGMETGGKLSKKRRTCTKRTCTKRTRTRRTRTKRTRTKR